MQSAIIFVAVFWLVVPQQQTSTLISKWAESMTNKTSDGTVPVHSCAENDRHVTSNRTSTCHLGYYCTNATCQCRKAPKGSVECRNYGIVFSDCSCASYYQEDNVVQFGACIYNFACASLNNASKYGVPNQYYQDTLCKPLNRTGTLCGRCLPDHYPLAYSYNINCIPCPHSNWNWLRYLMAAYLPLTLFYIVIVLLKINIVSSHINPVVLFGQGMSLSPIARGFLLFAWNTPVFLTAIKTILSLYGLWNLDFFRPFYSDLCLGIGVLPTLALDYAIAVYPLLLIITSYLLIDMYDRNYRVITIMSRPFRVLFSLFSRNWDVRTSVIDAFSALFLLSNIKFLSVSFDFLAPTQVYHLYGDTYNYSLRLFYAGDIEYFGREHLPYAILAIVMLCVFVILPVAILALYPFRFFQKFLNRFPIRWYNTLHTFVDSFQGCYKDGTEPGTRDCRWFSAFYISLRSFCLILYGITRGPSYFPLCSLFLLFFTLLLVVVQPYKSRFALHYKTNSTFVILYATFNVAVSPANGTGLFTLFLLFLLVLVPLVAILVFMLYGMFSRCRCCLRLVHRLHWQHRGYMAVDGDDDDADAYCDRVVNPQAYPTVPAGQMVHCS